VVGLPDFPATSTFPLGTPRRGKGLSVGVKADEKIAADRGLVALRYGPLIYYVERADQPSLNLALGSDGLTTEWRGDLLQAS